MQIIKSFQVFENSDARFGMGFEGAFHQQFAFQGRKEALRHRIIETIPDRSHGWSYPELATTIAEGDRGVLPGFNWSSQHGFGLQSLTPH
jgi:hypothetical protein